MKNIEIERSNLDDIGSIIINGVSSINDIRYHLFFTIYFKESNTKRIELPDEIEFTPSKKSKTFLIDIGSANNRDLRDISC